jgi:RNA polymerase sigma-70 factor, ECF subfamily
MIAAPNSTRKPRPVAEFMNESIYRRLRCRATAILRRETSDHRLEPADLLHEAFLRIARTQEPIDFQNESHVLALATLAMRRVLIDRARGVDSHLRMRCVPLEFGIQPSTGPNPEAGPLHDVLQYMQTSEERLYCIVQMRFFWGLGTEEIAAALSISSRTVKRDWRAARGWLRRELVRRAQGPTARLCSS